MDADLFSPADTTALLAIRAAIAGRRTTPADWLALFDSAGLTRDAGPVDGAGEAPRTPSRPTAD